MKVGREAELKVIYYSAPSTLRYHQAKWLSPPTFSDQAQKEVLSLGYPVKLISGIGLIDFMKELKIISNGILNSDWIKSVIEKK